MPDSGGIRFWRRSRQEGAQVKADFQARQALASLLDEAGMKDVEDLTARKEHIRAIKLIHELTGLSLGDSKRKYESVWR